MYSFMQDHAILIENYENLSTQIIHLFKFSEV